MERVSDGRFAAKPKRDKGKFTKGYPKPPSSGRKPGVQNKTTRAVKEFLAELCDDERVHRAIRKRIYKGDTIAFFRALEQVIGSPVRREQVDLNQHVDGKVEVVWVGKK